MKNKKYTYRAVWTGTRTKMYGKEHDNAEDCIKELNHFINAYLTNETVFVGIKKYVSGTYDELKP